MPVKPNAIKAWREGEVASGAKSDAGDALVIAEYLRLRQHKLRVAAPYSGQARALRTVVRTRGDLVEMRVAATNQLTALLDTHWPGAKAVFADVESPIALDFLSEKLRRGEVSDRRPFQTIDFSGGSPAKELSRVTEHL